MDGAGALHTLATTSTSTVLFRGSGRLPCWWLRTYGLIDEAVEGAAHRLGLGGAFESEASESFTPSAATCAGTYDAAASMSRWISFADSEWKYFATAGVADTDMALVFEPDPAAVPETLEALVQWTCVPNFKAPAVDWPYAHREYDLAACTYTTTQRTDRFWVQYKDVSVVKIPSRVRRPVEVFPFGGGGAEEQETSGYLMITKRQRILAAEAELLTDVGNPFPAFGVASLAGPWGLGGPGTCFADIVCFYAEDAEFRTNVKGPFMLVHSNYALDTQPSARLWLGVPGAAWQRVGGEWWLYVYYQVEPHDPASFEMREKIEAFDAGAGSALYETMYPPTSTRATGRACTGTLGEVPTGTAGEVDAPGEELLADVESGIAVSRFTLTAIQNEVVTAPAVPEWDWNGYSSTSAWTGPVTGEQLGYIRVWMTGGPVPVGMVQEWHAFVMAYSGERDALHKADPAPLSCGKELSLYFAANNYDEFSGNPRVNLKLPIFGVSWSGSGHGIWRCVAAEQGLGLDLDGDGTADHTTGIYGVDFFCDATPDDMSDRNLQVMSLGQVVHSKKDAAGDEAIDIDPDPVLLPDGSARVYFGAGNNAFQFVSAPLGVPCETVVPAGPAAPPGAEPLVIGNGPGSGGAINRAGRRRLAEMLANMVVDGRR